MPATAAIDNETLDHLLSVVDEGPQYNAFTAIRKSDLREWLLDLSKNDRRVIGKDIQKIEFGWPIGMPYCRPLGHGLWEVRSDLAGGRIARVIFCIVRSEMVLLHGFEKKTQKTPVHDIKLALGRKREIDE